MTGIETSPNSLKRKLHSIKIDMTPMVDLGFLLITFFIFTTSMAKPKITRLIMPTDGEPVPVKESKTITVLLDKDNVYLYKGEWEKAQLSNGILQTNYNVTTGFGNFIRQKQLEAIGEKDGCILSSNHCLHHPIKI